MSNNPYQNPPGANFQQELPQGMAVASLVTGILSLTLCGLFTAIPAIICGHIGVKQADRGEASGRSMAMAGMIDRTVNATPDVFGDYDIYGIRWMVDF